MLMAVEPGELLDSRTELQTPRVVQLAELGA